jgi:hypothetical protein
MVSVSLKGPSMELRLTYEGPIWGAQNDPRLAHKRDLRRKFHLQLKHFWNVNPYLKHGNPVAFEWSSGSVPKSGITYGATIAEWLAPRYRHPGSTARPGTWRW